MRKYTMMIKVRNGNLRARVFIAIFPQSGSSEGFAVGPFNVFTPSAGLFRFARGTYFFSNLATASDVVFANAIF